MGRLRSIAVAVSVGVALLTLTVFSGAARADDSRTLFVTEDTTLTDDHYGRVVIATDGVTLDCAWQKIIGDGAGRGITVDGRDNVTVRRCNISNFATGLFVTSTTNSWFFDIFSHHNRMPKNNNNPAWITGAGIWIQASSENLFFNGTASNNDGDGWDVVNSSNNMFAQFTAHQNRLAGGFFGSHATNNSIYMSSLTYNGAAGLLIADGATENTFNYGYAAYNEGAGFSINGNMHPARANRIENSTAEENAWVGFALENAATDNVLRANTAYRNGVAGFGVLWGATGNLLSGNTANDNLRYGFVAVDATYTTVDGNSASGNNVWDALQAGDTTGNLWTNNTFGTSTGI